MSTSPPGPSTETWVVLGSGNGSTNLGDEGMWEASVRVLRASRGQVEVITDAAPNWRPPVPDVRVLPYLYMTLRRGQRWLGPALAGKWPRLEQLISRPGREPYAFRASARSTFSPKGKLQVAWHDAIQASEGLIVSGAGAINDDFAGHGVASWDLMIAWAAQAKKPIAFIGQGVGPLTGDLNREVARRMLSRADVISVRERRSLAVITSLGIASDPEVTPDWAVINTPTSADRDEADNLKNTLTDGADFFALSIHRRADTRRGDLDRLASLTHSLIETVESNGYRVLFVPNMTSGRYSDDRETARLLQARWRQEDRKRLMVQGEPSSPGVTRALLGLSQGLITTRYHPLVFALAEGVASVGVSYDDYYDQKLCGASELFGVSKNVRRLGDPDISAESILQLLREQVVPDRGTELRERVERPLVSFLSR